MVIELRVVQFWSEIILVISNQTRAARSFDFEITRMISDQIALHSVQLPILTRAIVVNSKIFTWEIEIEIIENIYHSLILYTAISVNVGSKLKA